MHLRYIFRVVGFLSCASVLLIAYNNCSQLEPAQLEEQASLASGLSSCPVAPTSLQNPKSIRATVDLVNALPKPLTLDCLLANLQKPLDVYAVDNTFSAQPSAGPKSPRILLMKYPLILSVVPAGSGRLFLELSEFVDSTQTVKGELAFPVTKQIVMEDAFTHLLTPTGVTDCRFCHQNETAAGPSFSPDARKSNVLRPDAVSRITSTSLRNEALTCNRLIESYRCNMLEAIFIKGQGRDAAFP